MTTTWWKKMARQSRAQFSPKKPPSLRAKSSNLKNFVITDIIEQSQNFVITDIIEQSQKFCHYRHYRAISKILSLPTLSSNLVF